MSFSYCWTECHHKIEFLFQCNSAFTYCLVDVAGKLEMLWNLTVIREMSRECRNRLFLHFHEIEGICNCKES